MRGNDSFISAISTIWMDNYDPHKYFAGLKARSAMSLMGRIWYFSCALSQHSVLGPWATPASESLSTFYSQLRPEPSIRTVERRELNSWKGKWSCARLQDPTGPFSYTLILISNGYLLVGWSTLKHSFGHHVKMIIMEGESTNSVNSEIYVTGSELFCSIAHT